MKLINKNNILSLTQMLKMTKIELMALIVSKDIHAMGIDNLHKETLIDILNFELLIDQPQIWEGLQ